MAIVTPTYNLAQLKMPLPKGRRHLVSTMEIATATEPKFIGRIEAEEVAPHSYVGMLMAAGNEIVIAADQVSWSEKLPSSVVNQIVGENLVNRSGDTFTINNSAIPADVFDIDSSRPKEARFFVSEKQRFVVVDATGKRNIGVVKSVSTDGKTITAERRDESGTWNIGTSNLDIIWLGYNLDHCECPPCIGYRPYSPTYENSMYKDGVCQTYCEETLLAEGGWEAFKEENFNGLTLAPDIQLDEKLKELNMRTDHSIMWEHRTPKSVADAAGEPQGMMGIMQQLEGRALKMEGLIETIQDLNKLGAILKKKNVMMCYMDCTPEQYGKLMDLQLGNTHISYDPFTDRQSDLMYQGYKGIKLYNGVVILFREWDGLSGHSSSKLNKAYNFIITPAGKIEATINKVKRQVGHVTIGWFGTDSDVYKMRRDSNENDMNCGNININYVNKYTVMVFGADRFILGVNIV